MPSAARKVAKKLYLSPITNPVRPLYYSFVFLRRYFGRRIGGIFTKTFQTGEMSNFTYDLTENNLRYLAHIIAVVTGVPSNRIEEYLLEPRNDETLRQHILDISAAAGNG